MQIFWCCNLSRNLYLVMTSRFDWKNKARNLGEKQCLQSKHKTYSKGSTLLITWNIRYSWTSRCFSSTYCKLLRMLLFPVTPVSPTSHTDLKKESSTYHAYKKCSLPWSFSCFVLQHWITVEVIRLEQHVISGRKSVHFGLNCSF